MKITFVMPVLEVSGGARIIVGHAERLAARGHDVLFVAPRPRPKTIKQGLKKLLGRETTVTEKKDASIARSVVPLRLPEHFHEIVEDDVPDADVIIASWWETADWIKNFDPRKGTKVHFIQHYEGFPPMPADRVDDVWRLPLHKITIAQWLVDLGRERFGIERMALVPNSVDDHFRSSVPRTKGNPPTVGFLYHTADFKDFPTTLAVIDRLKRIRPDARFVSFGATKPAPGELPSNVEFHHLPPQEMITAIYGRCDVWLSTSRTEGFNLPPLEAMAGGTPAVCGKTGQPLEIIKNGQNGYLVEPQDVNAFTSAVCQVLSMPELAWQQMSKAAREAIAVPTWEESTDLFEAALKEALNQSPN